MGGEAFPFGETAGQAIGRTVSETVTGRNPDGRLCRSRLGAAVGGNQPDGGEDQMSTDETTMEELFKKGLALRREVLGAEYVDKSIDSANDFMMAFQHITTEWCWGYGWSRPGLDRKTRSMLNLAMLTALNRAAEVKLHVRGAINNGVSVEEIKEVLLHATIYCGIPAGLDAFKAANEVLQEMGKVT
jgi:4-carboxymuconolactone decarboxylase